MSKQRVRLVHYTTASAAESIRKSGFVDRYRNRVLFGFSFAPRKTTWSKGHKGDEAVHVEFDGNLVDPSGPDDSPGDVYRGTTTDAEWNALVDAVSKRVGLDWDVTPDDAWWKKREVFATSMRRELLRRGVDAVQAGAEIVVVNPAKLRIVEPSWWQRGPFAPDASRRRRTASDPILGMSQLGRGRDWTENLLGRRSPFGLRRASHPEVAADTHLIDVFRLPYKSLVNRIGRPHGRDSFRVGHFIWYFEDTAGFPWVIRDRGIEIEATQAALKRAPMVDWFVSGLDGNDTREFRRHLGLPFSGVDEILRAPRGRSRGTRSR